MGNIIYFNEKYYKELIDKILWCIEDDTSMQLWFCDNENISPLDNRIKLQMFVNFIYCCLKSNILHLDYEVDDMQRIMGINSIEELMNYLALGTLLENKNKDLYIYIWVAIQSYGTEKLDKIAKKCNLQAYDDFDLSYPHCQQFREEIEKAFVDSGFPLDWENPIFKVADNVFES